MARSHWLPSKRNVEKYWPLLLAVIVALIAFFAGWNLSSINQIKDILSSVINISSILIGFLGAMMSVLAAVAGHRVLKRIKNNNATELLRSYFSQSVGSGFVVAIGSTIMNLFVECKDDYARWLLIGWMFFVTYFLASAYRIMIVMGDILKTIVDDDTNESANMLTRVKGNATKVIPGGHRTNE